jgi:hypothetical protein
MARADKSARIIAVIETIRKGDFSDYSKAITYYNYGPIIVSRRIRSKTYSRKETNSFWY